MMSSQNIHLYLTKEHACSYLPGEMSINLVPDPAIYMNMSIYSQLIKLGYRRSGDFTYRPHCKECSACLPCRVPVETFLPNRNQKRCLAQNSDLQINITPAEYNEEHFNLYKKYLNYRHTDGEMSNPGPDEFNNFLYCDWSTTFFIDIRRNNRLVAVAVTDRVADGLSAVYNFFDPEESKRSLGTFCVLQQIKTASKKDLEYLYMGYLIHKSKKMSYKANFKPLQIFSNEKWEILENK